MEKLDVKRPRTIEGINRVADVDAVLRTILPWRNTDSDILRLQSEEVVMKCRNESEKQLVKILSRLGFTPLTKKAILGTSKHTAPAHWDMYPDTSATTVTASVQRYRVSLFLSTACSFKP